MLQKAHILGSLLPELTPHWAKEMGFMLRGVVFRGHVPHETKGFFQAQRPPATGKKLAPFGTLLTNLESRGSLQEEAALPGASGQLPS